MFKDKDHHLVARHGTKGQIKSENTCNSPRIIYNLSITINYMVTESQIQRIGRGSLYHKMYPSV